MPSLRDAATNPPGEASYAKDVVLIALFQWTEWAINGAQPVSPFFTTPEKAGRWRRDHPPLIDGNGPTLWKFVDGQRVRLEPGELARAFNEFAAYQEPRYQQLDLGPEIVGFP